MWVRYPAGGQAEPERRELREDLALVRGCRCRGRSQNAEIRSVATISKWSPASYKSRTLPRRTGVSPGNDVSSRGAGMTMAVPPPSGQRNLGCHREPRTGQRRRKQHLTDCLPTPQDPAAPWKPLAGSKSPCGNGLGPDLYSRVPASDARTLPHVRRRRSGRRALCVVPSGSGPRRSLGQNCAGGGWSSCCSRWSRR